MNTKYIPEMNSIIAEWKSVCAENVARTFPGEKLNKQEFASKSWTDIISATYNLMYEPSDERRAYSTNCFILGMAAGPTKLRGFDRNPDVYLFYKKTFGPALRCATSMLDEGIYIANPGDYCVLPGGTPYNDGLPVSLKYITPRAVEMHAVSKNPDSYKVNDILFSKHLGIFIVRSVPELPQPALDWAAKHNIKVY